MVRTRSKKFARLMRKRTKDSRCLRASREKKLVSFYRNVKVERDGDIAIVNICRPEVKNALNDQTMNEIDRHSRSWMPMRA